MRISHKVEFTDDFVFYVLLRYILFQIFGNINVQSEKQFVQRVGARILLLILNQVNRRIIIPLNSDNFSLEILPANRLFRIESLISLKNSFSLSILHPLKIYWDDTIAFLIKVLRQNNIILLTKQNN